MARLLRDLDYSGIDTAVLTQIIQSNQQFLLDIEQAAQTEMISYLAQRYKTSEIFSNTTTFDPTVVYQAKNLVQYTETAFSATSPYNIGDRVSHSGSIYEANTSISAAAFDSTQWNFICVDFALFYVTLPNPEYDPATSYVPGNIVWFNNKNYTCVQACKNIDPTMSQFWGTGTAYSVTGVYPDDITKWSAGDNRNQQIVLFLRDITLYHLYRLRINPRNIPDQVKESYNGNSPTDSGGAIGWLKSVAHGNVQADLPVYSPQQGMSMRYGNAATFDGPSTNMMW